MSPDPPRKGDGAETVKSKSSVGGIEDSSRHATMLTEDRTTDDKKGTRYKYS